MRRRSLQDTLRTAILRSPLSRYALAKRARIADSILSRFMNRKMGISLDTAECLAKALGLALRDAP